MAAVFLIGICLVGVFNSINMIGGFASIFVSLAVVAVMVGRLIRGVGRPLTAGRDRMHRRLL